MPRSDWNMQVAISVPHCKETEGTWLQTETLAAVATVKWHAQPICIEYAIDRKGWILYRRPPAIQPFNAFAGQSDADYGQQHPVCHRCSRPNPRGLVYCFHCCGILEGAVEENIFETRKRQASGTGRDESRGGESHPSNTRGADSEVGELRRSVVLKVRALDDPFTNPRNRGLHTTGHQTIAEAFSDYCKTHYKRTILPKGCPVYEADPTIRFTYEKGETALQERCRNDPFYMNQLETHVRANFPHFIGLDEPFDYAYVDFMCRSGIERDRNPLVLPMSKKRRKEMNSGQQQIYSEQPDLRNTAPLRTHADYQDVVSRTQTAAKAATASKGRGRGRGQARDQQWQQDNQWHGWSNRQDSWNSWGRW